MIRLAQSETYYPCKQESDSTVTAIAIGICRLSDGYWLDWNDSTFKNTGWTTQYQALTEDENGLWVYTTGWAIPDANASYMIQWKITNATETFYAEGYQIIVNSGLLDKLPDIAAILEDTGTTLPATLTTIEGKINTIDDFVDTEVAAILADTGTDGVPLTAAAVDAILDEVVDNDGTSITLRGAIKLILSVLTGKSSGGGTATVVFRDVADVKNRISATVDADGNRTAVGTRDAT